MKPQNIHFLNEKSRRFTEEDDILSYKPYTLFWKSLEERHKGKFPGGHVLYAAVKFEGSVYYIKHFEGDADSRHVSVMEGIRKLFPEKFFDGEKIIRAIKSQEQGFLLSNGIYVSRSKAARVAERANQYLPEESHRKGCVLISEYLW